MTHILNFLYGDDKRSPTRELSLNGATSTADLFIAGEGFAPGPGASQVIFSGQSIRIEGEQRVASSRDNMELTVQVHVNGDTPLHTQHIVNTILRFFNEAMLYHEDGVGAKVWLEYRWNTDSDLDSLPRPAFGQLNYYAEVLHAEIVNYPGDLHNGALAAGQLNELEINVTCRGAYWEGLEDFAGDTDALADASDDVINYGTVVWALSDFSIECWFKIQSTSTAYDIWHLLDSLYHGYRLTHTASNQISIYTDDNGDDPDPYGEQDTSSALGSSANDWVHLVFAADVNGTGTVYVNGASSISSIDLTEGPLTSVTLYVGGSSGSVLNECSTAIAGVRVYESILSATEVLDLYNEQLPIYSAASQQTLSPFLKTRSGDGVFENVDGVLNSVAQDNWGVISGVAGTAPAKVRFEIDPPTTTPEKTYHLGCRYSPSAITPAGILWLDFDVTADTPGNSSGDAYDTDTTSGSGTDTSIHSATITSPQKGRFKVISRYKVTGSAVDAKPFYQFGSDTTNRIFGDEQEIATNASFLMRDFGDLFIDWSFFETPPEITVGIYATETAASASTVQIDFILLLPYPQCKVDALGHASITLASGDTLVIHEKTAMIEDASSSDELLYLFNHEGDEIQLMPNQYNHIWLVQGEDGVAYPVADTATVKAYVTPRWQLPGGIAG